MSISQPSPADVKVIYPTAQSDENIQAFIDDATLIVQRCIANADPATQKAVIKWTTAHLMSTGSGGEVTTEKIGDASKSYTAAAGDNLASSKYGQRAMLIDTTGCLKNLGKSKALLQVL